MKQMKKSLIYTLMLAVASVLMMSCENDFDNAIANPDQSDLADLAAMVRFEEPVLGVTLTPDISFAGTLVDPGDNVASYDLRVSLDGTNFTPFTSVTTFPSELTVTLADTESTLGQSLPPGTSVTFDAIITRADGTQFTSDNLTGDTFNQGQRQAMTFTAFVSCPFVASDAAGTYDVTNDAIGFALATTFDATASGTTLSMIDPFGYGLGDVVDIEVDGDTGSATVAAQDGWDSDALGLGFGRGHVTAAGFVFSCAGIITLDVNWQVAAGSFGTGNFSAQKQ
jgi:hypothetical protein